MTFQINASTAFAALLGLSAPVMMSGCQRGDSQSAATATSAGQKSHQEVDDQPITFEERVTIIRDVVKQNEDKPNGPQRVLDRVDQEYDQMAVDAYSEAVAVKKGQKAKMGGQVGLIFFPLGVDPTFFDHPELSAHYQKRRANRFATIEVQLGKDFAVHYCEERTRRERIAHFPADSWDLSIYEFCAVSYQKGSQEDLKYAFYQMVKPSFESGPDLSF